MTRKRKIECAQSDEGTLDYERNRLSAYGYHSVSENEPSNLTTPYHDINVTRCTLSHKSGHSGYQSCGSIDSKRKYGSGEMETREDMLGEEKNGKKGNKDFPAEIVAYLKNIETMKLRDGQIDNMVLYKCVEECSNEEETLLSFKYSSVIIENIFGSSQYGAELFLSRLSRLKHKRLLGLLFLGSASRTIETLFYALHPLEHRHVELLEMFSDLLCDHWNDAVECQHSARLLRCFTYLTCGLGKKREKDMNKKPASSQPVVFQSEDVRTRLFRIFGRISSLALESISTPRLENVYLSLVVQDVIDADNVAKMGKCRDVVETILKTSSADDLRQLWYGKNSSRVWEKVLASCREETLQLLWTNVVTEHVFELANHSFANFPLQKFIANVKSLELATDICHEATPLLQFFLSKDRWGVAQSLLLCAVNHETLQKPLLKELRKFFRAGTAQSRLDFFFNVITLNKYNGNTFDVDDCCLHGGLILEALLSFHKVKTLSACLEALSTSDVVKMARNRCASRVIQAVFTSRSISVIVKEKLIAAFDDDWESLISDVYGSHVFESIWNCPLFNMKRRQNLMEKLVHIQSDSKFWKFAMLGCDIHLFRKNRKAWVQKMEKSLEGVRCRNRVHLNPVALKNRKASKRQQHANKNL